MEISKEQELLAANLILPIVKDIVAPKILSCFYGKKNTEKYEKNFETYLFRRYIKFLTLETLAFPNRQTQFDVLYEPLTLTITTTNDFLGDIIVNDSLDVLSFFKNFYRIILEDSAGMGKSTIVKKFFKLLVEKKQGIPMLIELRQINKDNTIIDEVKNQLSQPAAIFDIDTIIDLINTNGFVFLFDGYDEIPIGSKEFVTENLHDFIEKSPDNIFVITSRPDDSLTSFGSFQKINIKPLEEKQAFNLIKRYDKYNYKSISNILIDEITKSHNKAIDEFLGNPLLVSLLFKAYDFKNDIPLKKNQFYWQVFSALYEKHDLSKEGHFKRKILTNLHFDDFDRVLRHVSYFTAIENKIEYDIPYLLSIIEKSKKYFPDLKFKSSDFINDILESVPLFKMDGIYIMWSHKSLQDYFTAKFLWLDSKENQLNILLKMFSYDKQQSFSNIISIYCELDPITFDKTFLYWILKDFIKYYDENKDNYIKFSIKSIKKRLGYTYFNHLAFFLVKEDLRKIFNENITYEDLFKKYNIDIAELPVNYGGSSFEFKIPRVTAHSFYNPLKRHSHGLQQLMYRTYPDIFKLVISSVQQKNKLSLEIGKLYIEDNLINEFDDQATFDLVNDLSSRGIYVDYDRALKKLSQLEKSLKVPTNNELLNW